MLARQDKTMIKQTISFVRKNMMKAKLIDVLILYEEAREELERRDYDTRN